MSDALVLLKQTLEISKEPEYLLSDNSSTNEIDKASSVRFADDTTLPLSSTTRFLRGEIALDLRSILYAYQQRETPLTEYIALCQEKGIENLSFVEKNELTSFLSGSDTSLSSTNIAPLPGSKRAAEGEHAGNDAKRVTTQSDIVRRIYAQEHRTKPFSSCLHGKKQVDFGSVQREARETFLVSKTVRPSSNGNKPMVDKAKSRLRDPIILLSPSASSLITMHNIKKFLEEGVFVAPEVAARETGGPAPEVLSLAYKSRHQAGKTLRFVVVESTDKFKPDYWDRLLVVFTTGQAWQFKPYAPQFSDPRSLFQRTKGILVRYADEPTNAAEREWNVQGIQINRSQRYNDRVTVSTFWDSVEKWIEQKGKKEFYRHERRT